MAICAVDLGIKLERNNIEAVDQSIIFDMFRKVDVTNRQGDTFSVSFHDVITGDLVPQKVGTVQNGCGAKTYTECNCTDLVRQIMKVDNRINCGFKFSNCLSSFRNIEDATIRNEVVANELQMREQMLSTRVKASLNKAIIREIVAGGTDLDKQLDTATAELEDIMAALNEIYMKFNDQGYSLQNRYVVMDPALFFKLVQGKLNNIGCCANLVYVQGVVPMLEFLGLKVYQMTGLQSTYGVNLLAIHGDFVVLGTKCGSNLNGEIEVDRNFDIVDSGVGTINKYDAFLAEYIYGLLLTEAAILISGSPLLKKEENKIPNEEPIEIP